MSTPNVNENTGPMRWGSIGFIIGLIGFVLAYLDRQESTGTLFVIGQVIAYAGAALFVIGFGRLFILFFNKEDAPNK
jgi:hypothetical protein